jgi:predicted aspartyl protease
MQKAGQVLRTVPSQVGVLFILCIALLLSGCTANLKGVSGPVTWQATDLRLIERSVSGAARDMYAFTLVLEETQGAALTFTHLEYTISQPAFNPTGETRQAVIIWKLRPYGELRLPFSSYWYCATTLTTACRRGGAIAPWYHIILTGTDDQGRAVRATIDFRLPQNPPLPPPRTALATIGDSGAIPFQTVNNRILVHAVLNHKTHVTLLLDTGSTETFLTPDTVKRLGIGPIADAPKRTTTVLGGRQVEFPLVQLSTIAVGDAVVQALQVGVLASFPDAYLVDGILGGSFLQHFTMTLDYATSRLRLVPQDAIVLLPATPALLPVVRCTVPMQVMGHHILVRAVLNRTASVTLLLDTGATHTLLTPDTAQRLGISPPADAPRHTAWVADGQLQEAPFVPLTTLAVGEAVVENLLVGVAALFPQVPGVDGLLGGDFLGQFTVILDRAAHQIRLETHQTRSGQ